MPQLGVTPAEMRVMIDLLEAACQSRTLTDEQLASLSFDPMDIPITFRDEEIVRVTIVTK